MLSSVLFLPSYPSPCLPNWPLHSSLSLFFSRDVSNYFFLLFFSIIISYAFHIFGGFGFLWTSWFALQIQLHPAAIFVRLYSLISGSLISSFTLFRYFSSSVLVYLYSSFLVLLIFLIRSDCSSLYCQKIPICFCVCFLMLG